MTTVVPAPAIWAEMRVWTVSPASNGGFTVLCDGEPVNWFFYFGRAVNEARKLNCAEILRLQRLKDAGQ